MSLRNLLLSLACLAAVCIASVVIVVRSYDVQAEFIGESLTKLLLQLLVISIAGQVAALVMGEYQRSRQRVAATNEYRQQFLNRMIDIYVRAKKIRGRLRAETQPAIVGPRDELTEGAIDTAILAEQMEDLRYDMLYLAEEARRLPFVFTNPERLKDEIKFLDAYLEEILDEHLSSELADGQADADLAQLAKLADFLGPYHVSDKRRKVQETYAALTETVRRDILMSA